MTKIFSRLMALTLFVALLAAPEALAQQTAPPTQQPPVEIDFTDNELDAFAEAYVDVEALQAQYQSEFGAVDDAEQAQQIQQRFQIDVLQTIENQGIDPETYDQIIRATQVDPEFTEDVLTRIASARQDRMDG